MSAEQKRLMILNKVGAYNMLVNGREQRDFNSGQISARGKFTGETLLNIGKMRF